MSKPKKATKPRKSPPNAKRGAITKRQDLSLPERIEQVAMEGDLSVLSLAERLMYVRSFCRALGIDWRGRPFAYIVLNNKMVLYALRNCTDQLRRVHGISVIESRRMQEGDLTIIEVKVQDRTGRTDTGTGAWPTAGLKGEAVVNAILKAETKAKRRATLSICGLGMLDESELDTIDDIQAVSSSGRMVEIEQPQLESGKAYELAVLLAQEEIRRGYTGPFKELVALKQDTLAKQTPAQIESLYERLTNPPQQASPTAKGTAEGTGAAGPAIASAPDSYDGIIFKLKGEMYEASGPKENLRNSWQLLKPFWRDDAKQFLLKPEQLGKLSRALEENKVPFRIE